MKFLLILIIFLVSCSENNPQDPWKGIEDPIFVSSNYSHKSKMNLASLLEFQKVSSDVKITTKVTCASVKSESKEVSRTRVFLPHEFKSSLAVFRILPKETILSPQNYESCSIKILEENSLGSSNQIFLSDVKVDDFVGVKNELALLGPDVSNIDARKEDELLHHQKLGEHRVEAPSKSAYLTDSSLVCSKSDFLTKNKELNSDEVHLNEFSFTKNQEFPVQLCRVFSFTSSGNVMVSKRFKLQTKAPKITVTDFRYYPEAVDKYFYEKSHPLNIPLISIQLLNEHPFPIHYKLTPEHSSGFNLFAHFYPFVGHIPRDFVLFQRIEALLYWTANRDLKSNKTFTLKQGESIHLELKIKSDFLCLVGRPLLGKKAVTVGNDRTHPEYGLSFEINREHPIFDIRRLQIEDDGSSELISTDLIRNTFVNKTRTTKHINSFNKNNFIEDFFYKETYLYDQKNISNILDAFSNAPKDKDGNKITDLEAAGKMQHALRACNYL